jgi:hypothetical protein
MFGRLSMYIRYDSYISNITTYAPDHYIIACFICQWHNDSRKLRCNPKAWSGRALHTPSGKNRVLLWFRQSLGVCVHLPFNFFSRLHRNFLYMPSYMVSLQNDIYYCSSLPVPTEQHLLRVRVMSTRVGVSTLLRPISFYSP